MSFIKKKAAILNSQSSSSASSSSSSSSSASASASASSSKHERIPYKLTESSTSTRKAFDKSPFVSYRGYEAKPVAWCDKYFTYKHGDQKITGTGFSNSYLKKDGKYVGFASTSFTRNSIEHCKTCDSKVIQETAHRCTYIFKNPPINNTNFKKDLCNYNYSRHKCNSCKK